MNPLRRKMQQKEHLPQVKETVDNPPGRITFKKHKEIEAIILDLKQCMMTRWNE
jgi:uncharacterized protein (UPF0218 family)